MRERDDERRRAPVRARYRAARGEDAGTVDWARRFDHMQQHTGQHVLSRAFI